MTICQGKLSKQAGQPVPDDGSVTWEGQTFAARTPHGITYALARLLVDAACPDQAWEAYGPDGQRRLFGSSIHGLSKRTLTEGDATGLRRIRWMPFPRVA